MNEFFFLKKAAKMLSFAVCKISMISIWFLFLDWTDGPVRVLNYVPSCPTCLTRLRAFASYLPSLFYVLTCLLFFTCLMCLHFFTSLTGPYFFTCLTCLQFFTYLHFFKCFQFSTYLTRLHFFHKMWNNPQSIATSWNMQERGKNQK